MAVICIDSTHREVSLSMYRQALFGSSKICAFPFDAEFFSGRNVAVAHRTLATVSGSSCRQFFQTHARNRGNTNLALTPGTTISVKT
jgi:hypothetical protein